jgi:arylsulfatase A-like enzyme
MVCDAAINFLKGYDGQDPFFIYVSFLAPHDPRTMPQEFHDMYDPDKIKLPPNYAGGHPFNNGHLKGRDESLIDWPRNPKAVRRHIAEYYGMISHLDAQLGRVYDALDAAGVADDTIILFAADNGLAVGQHGLMGKQNLYDHSVRVPLIVSGPGIPKGEQRDAFVYLLDIFPTLCELSGTEIPASVEGKSMVPLIQDPARKNRETLYFAFRGFQRGVRDEQYKLVEYVVQGEHNMTQLFDLVNDPWEMNNLAEDPAYADVLSQLRAEMIRYSHEWNDRDSEWGQMFWPVYDQSVSN